jgi:two-component system LytT family sensor kinase
LYFAKLKQVNIFKVSSKDVKVLLFIRPPFMVLLCYVLFGRAYFNDIKIFIPATVVAVLVTVATWRLHIYADHFLRKRFFNTNHTVKRVALSVLFHVIIASVFIAILFLWAGAVHFLGHSFTWGGFVSGLLVGLCTNLSATGFHEGVYTFENWKRTLIEAEELKKLTLKNRLAGLRNQTNPHFFFNSINTLSGLIEIDTGKADRFLDEMCIVYRYLLRNEPDTFVPLYKELNFIRSWIYLIQTRYGNSIQFTINGNELAQSVSISRLTLLAFLEAILDTYIIDKKACFKITIDVKDDCIKIAHSVHEKKSPGYKKNSGQIEEIRMMHRLLELPDIEEHSDNDIKTISIPLQQSAFSYAYL